MSGDSLTGEYKTGSMEGENECTSDEEGSILTHTLVFRSGSKRMYNYLGILCLALLLATFLAVADFSVRTIRSFDNP